ETGRLLQSHKDPKSPFDGTVVHVALVGLGNGEYLAAETAGAEITWYRPGVPKSARTVKGHEGRVMGVAFTRDGKTLVSLGDDGIVRYWNTADGKETAKVAVPPMKQDHDLKGNLA